MEKEFIPYEQALALKELGFNNRFTTNEIRFVQQCFGGYSERGEICYLPTHTAYREVDAPTFSQAFRWFREKYDLVHTVYSNASGYLWELHYNQQRGGTHICDSGESGDCEMSGMFTTYEKAELECLKKLIEIIKKQKGL